jgi:hypothetical protein
MCCPSSANSNESPDAGVDAGDPDAGEEQAVVPLCLDIDAGDPSSPCPPDPEFHLHVDADRDGKVDADHTGLDKWEFGKGKKGAILLCNNDDDDGKPAPDRKSDNTDAVVNAGNDNDEIAPLDIRKDGAGSAPASWTATLEVPPGDKDHIRIFDSRSSGGKEIIGPTAGNKYTFPDLKFTTKEFGMEATKYAGKAWSGETKVKLTLNKGGATVVEEAAVRVAPWMMPNHLDQATKVYVVEFTKVAWQMRRPPGDPDTSEDNSRFVKELSSLVSSAGCAIKTHPSDDIWMQDCMEIGFSNLPTKGYSAVLRTPRSRDLVTFPETLRQVDFGYLEPGDMGSVNTFNSGGNIECTPPFTKGGKKFPWGRIYFGPGRLADRFDAEVKEIFKKQLVQDPIEIDTSFLTVGHVDEIISFVPAPGDKGFKLVLASPELAFDILNKNKAANGSSKLLVGRKFPRRDSTGTLTWKDAEVTISDFLTKGIPGLSLTAAQLTAANDKAKAAIKKARDIFVKELDLKDSDIIDVPVLYLTDDPLRGMLDALTAGIVNMLVLNKTCIPPKPFGPEVGGKDLFEEDMKTKLEALGLTVKFLDDWYEYHIRNGEVHCGTNTLRAKVKVDWWEFEK